MWAWYMLRQICLSVCQSVILYIAISCIWLRDTRRCGGRGSCEDQRTIVDEMTCVNKTEKTCKRVKPKLHYFDLLWICCTTNPQQIEVMEFTPKARQYPHNKILHVISVFPWLVGSCIHNWYNINDLGWLWAAIIPFVSKYIGRRAVSLRRHGSLVDYQCTAKQNCAGLFRTIATNFES